MKKILITQRLVENDSYFEIREAIDINYPKLFSTAGYLPITLPYEVNIEDYFNNFNISGVVLTGGNDLYCCNPNELSLKRDKFETELLEYCSKNEIPVLGLCRGMQMMGVFAGAALKPADGHVRTRHQLQGEIIGEVNSYHNMILADCPPGYKVTAVSESGDIEAIKHNTLPWEGWMWHPEREETFPEKDINRLRGLIT